MATKTSETRQQQDAYCPHCHLLMEKRTGESWPPMPLRCPHCRG